MRAASDHAGCLDQMQRIKAMHLSTGYSDWAYNWAVCHHDRAEPMRGWGRVSGANGTQWANLNYWAVVALYDGRFDPLTDAHKRAFLRLFRSAPQGGNRDVKPHSAFFNTGCPWDPIRDWIAAGVPEPGGVIPPFFPPQRGPSVLLDYKGRPLDFSVDAGGQLGQTGDLGAGTLQVGPILASGLVPRTDRLDGKVIGDNIYLAGPAATDDGAPDETIWTIFDGKQNRWGSWRIPSHRA